jgi:hypothetical protein
MNNKQYSINNIQGINKRTIRKDNKQKKTKIF